MATSLIHCLNCDEQDDIYQCKGCSQTFCYRHLSNHREEIEQNLNQLQDHCNFFREDLSNSKNNSPLIEQINQWEKESINTIKQTANKHRGEILNFIIQIEKNLNDLSEQTKQISKETKLNETLLNEIIEKLNYLKQEFNKPPNISLKQHPTSFINQIDIITSLSKGKKWKQHAITVAGGNDRGNQLNQLSYPYGIFVGDNQTIYIADSRNHRIVEWKSNTQYGRIVAGGNGQGKQTNQLSNPTDVLIDKENNSFIIADWGNNRVMRWSRENNTTNGQILIDDIDCWGLTMDQNGSLYVCDCEKNEVRRWKRGEKKGTVVAGGNGKGNQLNQLNVPTFIFVDENDSLYVSDRDNHRVMKWKKDVKEGIVVAGGNGEGNSLKQLSHPQGVIVDQLGQIYVADYFSHRVMCWCEGDVEGRIVVGGNGEGEQSNQLHCPTGLSFDVEGNLYVVDDENDRIQKFEIDLN